MRFEGGRQQHLLPDRGWTRRDDACDASLPPVNGGGGNCTDTLASGTSCVPYCDAGYMKKGVTTCADGVLTNVSYCVPDVTTRSDLKAAVDACVGDRLCELTMPHWNVSRVTNMSFLFEGKTSFDVDISQWEMSQVTNAQGMFHGASSFSQGITGWTLASGAKTTGMFTGANTWLSRGHRGDDSDTTDGPPSAWVASGLCLENERVQSGWRVACGAGKYNGPGDDPALGVDTDCDGFGTLATLKTAVTNCLAVDPTGVACCSRLSVNCGPAGTTEMADWDVSLVTSMRELFYGKSQFTTRHIAVGHLACHGHVPDVPRCQGVQPRYRCVGTRRASRPWRRCSTDADAFNEDIGMDLRALRTCRDDATPAQLQTWLHVPRCQRVQ